MNNKVLAIAPNTSSVIRFSPQWDIEKAWFDLSQMKQFMENSQTPDALEKGIDVVFALRIAQVNGFADRELSPLALDTRQCLLEIEQLVQGVDPELSGICEALSHELQKIEDRISPEPKVDTVHRNENR